MIARLWLLALLPVLAAGPDVRRIPAGDDGPACLFVVPEGAEKGIPLVVALHESGETPEDAVRRYGDAAAKSAYALLCPAARGLAFDAADADGVAKRTEAVRAELGAGPVHLAGSSDAGRTAVLFAFARSRLFRGVVALGADAPDVREKAARLRVLVMKGVEDRPRAGRESVERLADRVEVVDFREMPGTGVEPDAASLAYAFSFLDVASGRPATGRVPALAWRAATAGLAEAKASGRRALVYLTDAAPAHRERTGEIDGIVLFDPELRGALEEAVPVLAPRDQSEKLFPEARLAAGPALLVVSPEGVVLAAQQKKLSAKALVEALRSR